MYKNERDRLADIMQKSNKKVSEIIHERIGGVIKEKGKFSFKTDVDKRSMYEIEADYLLDNGVLFPLKEDSEIWLVSDGAIIRGKITEFTYHSFGIIKYCYTAALDNKEDFLFSETQIGTKVFLSEEEAKEALERQRSVSLINGHTEE